jgi:hypothetical protein
MESRSASEVPTRDCAENATFENVMPAVTYKAEQDNNAPEILRSVCIVQAHSHTLMNCRTLCVGVYLHNDIALFFCARLSRHSYLYSIDKIMFAASDRRAASSKNVEYAVSFRSGCSLSESAGLAFKETNGACIVDEVPPDSSVILGSLVTGEKIQCCAFYKAVCPLLCTHRSRLLRFFTIPTILHC